MSARRPAVVFALVLAAVTIAKLAIVASGADHDVDAYAHALAGRRMLLDPADASVHWVWLPLVHSMYSVATLAGGGLSTLRLLNVAASSAAPVVLVVWLREHERRRAESSGASASSGARAESITPWLAGALLAADPLCMWLGVTGQTEALFQLLVLGAGLALARRSFVAAGALFAAAALTRYEAWGLLPVVAWLVVREVREVRDVRGRTAVARIDSDVASREQSHWPQGGPTSRRTETWVPPGAHSAAWLSRLRSLATASSAWLLPAAAVLAWCAWHARATGEPLQFLRLNREFVTGYLGGVGYLWGQQPIVPLMLVLYAVIVPSWNMLGAVHVLAVVGLPRALRELPRELLALGFALLAIVTIGLLRRSHLGLARHAVAMAPLFGALVAVGAGVLAEQLGRRSPRFVGPRGREGVGLAVLALVLAVRTVPEGVALWRATTRAFVVEAEAARALVAVARPGEPVFCEDGKIEVLSELAPDRFVRWQIVDVSPFHVGLSAREHGSALVVSAPDRARHLEGGAIVWEGAGLAISRHEGAP